MSREVFFQNSGKNLAEKGGNSIEPSNRTYTEIFGPQHGRERSATQTALLIAASFRT